ncbi:hypothetical protein [Consotaella salsifontis]|uniref:Uncharacterized protein n=1 Tax=Consotaella salsifontis TaxID=1365950 RepID=A0A1T4R5P3_9HYPH|nr:hypothetical protein [Consotaella salsifontis]SKA10988.1 hypothetical protein SAMN05428963_10625 [Consotaella salsifontis]
MTLQDELDRAARQYDEQAEINRIESEDTLRSNGASEEEVRTMLAWLDEELSRDRAAMLLKLEGWLRRGGQPLQ